MKRILSLLLALITVLSVPVTASATTSAHKGASSWAIESIVESEKLGLIPKELYPLRYKEPITREEFSSLIVKLHELTTGEEMKLERWQVFYDVDESNPYKDYIYKVDYAHIAGETGRDAAYRASFSPKGNLTREQAATMTTRLFRNLGHIFKDLKETQFNDASKISTWAEREVQIMQSEGILTGVGNGNFAPKDSYTVEQSMVTMLRVFKHLHKQAYPEQMILDNILKVESEYPTGTPWGFDTRMPGKEGNPYRMGSTACGGFVGLLANAALNDLNAYVPVRSQPNHDEVKIGDVIVYDAGYSLKDHAVTVIAVDEDGLLTVAEGNYSGEVVWGRKFRLAKSFLLFTRYPVRQDKWIEYVENQDPVKSVRPTLPVKTSEQLQDEKMGVLVNNSGTDGDLYSKLDLVKNVQKDIDALSDITEVMEFLQKTYTRYYNRGLDKGSEVSLEEYMRLSLNTFYSIAEANHPKDSLSYVEGPSAIKYTIETMGGTYKN